MSTDTSNATIFVAMWNLPGYLPEMEPFRTLSEEKAREFLADELDSMSNPFEEGDALGDGYAALAKEIRSGLSVAAEIGGYVYSIEQSEPIDDEEARRVSLAMHLDCELSDVEEASYGDNLFEAESETWLVVTDDEADVVWDEQLDSYLDECVLEELPALLMQYFDREAWKRDARHDGRGHTISGYDGEEHDSNGFVLFRVN